MWIVVIIKFSYSEHESVYEQCPHYLAQSMNDVGIRTFRTVTSFKTLFLFHSRIAVVLIINEEHVRFCKVTQSFRSDKTIG